MRKYASVEPTIWIGETGRQWRAHGPEYHLLGLYLLTNPYANNYGLYYLPTVVISEDTGIPPNLALTILRYFGEQDFALYHELRQWVWVKNMAAKQLGIVRMLDPNSTRAKGVQNWYRTLQSNPFLGPFFDCYAELFHLEQRREDGSRALLPSNGAITDPLFEQWFAHYPKASAKAAAFKVWRELDPPPDESFTAKAIEAVERHKQSIAWSREQGRFIPDADRWLEKERWNDTAENAADPYATWAQGKINEAV